MAKFYGNVGYIKNTEVQPGVWTDQTIEKPYYGNIPSCCPTAKTGRKSSIN